MDAPHLQLNLNSLNQHHFDGAIDHVVVPAFKGDLAIYRGHCPLVALLRPGRLKIVRENSELDFYYVSGGIVEVFHNQVLILADNLTRAEELSEAETIREKEAIDQQILSQREGRNYGKMLTKIAQAKAKLRTLNSYIKSSRRS